MHSFTLLIYAFDKYLIQICMNACKVSMFFQMDGYKMRIYNLLCLSVHIHKTLISYTYSLS